MNLAQAAWEDTKAGVVKEMIDRHRPKDGDEDFRGFGMVLLEPALHHRDLLTLSPGIPAPFGPSRSARMERGLPRAQASLMVIIR